MYLVPLYDLLNKVYTDAAIQPMRKRNEFAALYELIDRHTPCSGTTPIFIADRGFHAYNVFAHAIENDAFFVIRAADMKMKRLLGSDLPKEEIFDIQVVRYLTRSHSKKKYLYPESADQYRYICPEVAFDYFPAEGYGEYEISLRVIRFPLGNGTYENIITNLPENEFSAAEIKEIYRLRWGIETSFCTLKHAIAAVNFHSKSRQMITHEIWARLILFNFCSYITGQVTFEEQKRKHIHQVDFSIAFKTCRHFLRLHSGEEPPDVEDLIRKHTLPVRPSRNFARQQRFQVPVSFTYRF
ncbi:MAG: transposase [Lachnospiraceae bacterium]|nr:transposase [Lachnospiraceae bacterium]